MERFKEILSSLLDKTPWFRPMCAEACNPISHELAIAGLHITICRDHNHEFTVTYVPFRPFEYPEEEAIAETIKTIIEDIITEEIR